MDVNDSPSTGMPTVTCSLQSTLKLALAKTNHVFKSVNVYLDSQVGISTGTRYETKYSYQMETVSYCRSEVSY